MNATHEITLTETPLHPEERETVEAWLAAKRAAKQADLILEKLGPRVLALVKDRIQPDGDEIPGLPPEPMLFVGGARIGCGRRSVWSGYSPVIAGLKDSLKQEQQKEQKDGPAVETLAEFPVMWELEKFAGQAVTGVAPSLWVRMFGK